MPAGLGGSVGQVEARGIDSVVAQVRSASMSMLYWSTKFFVRLGEHDDADYTQPAGIRLGCPLSLHLVLVAMSAHAGREDGGQRAGGPRQDRRHTGGRGVVSGRHDVVVGHDARVAGILVGE